MMYMLIVSLESIIKHFKKIISTLMLLTIFNSFLIAINIMYSILLIIL